MHTSDFSLTNKCDLWCKSRLPGGLGSSPLAEVEDHVKKIEDQLTYLNQKKTASAHGHLQGWIVDICQIGQRFSKDRRILGHLCETQTH